jgi:RNA polymerase sigma factor (sigma-70 family)
MKTTRTMRRKISSPFANHVTRKRREPTDDITEEDIEWLACAATGKMIRKALASQYDLDELASRAMEHTAYTIRMWDRSRCPAGYKMSQWVLSMTIRHLRQMIKLHVMKWQRRNVKMVNFSRAANSIAESAEKEFNAQYIEIYYNNFVKTCKSGETVEIDVIDQRPKLKEEVKRDRFIAMLARIGVWEERVREWIYDYYVVGKTLKQIAEPLGYCPWNVGGQMKRALQNVNLEKAIEELA